MSPATVLAAAALAAAGPGPEPVSGQGYVFLPFRGGIAFEVEVDVATIASPNEHEAQILDVRGDLVTMVDTYASKPGADGRCRDGREVWVRLLDLAARRERRGVLARSCHRQVTAGEPLVTWTPDGSGFTVNLTSGEPVRVDARGA